MSYSILITVFYLLPAKLEEQFNQTLSKSTSGEDFLMCKATLLIFRHCCLEIGLWSEYSRWYSSYKLNVDTAKVFYSLLTELLPIDLPAALAAHIKTVIIVPLSCYVHYAIFMFIFFNLLLLLATQSNRILC